MYRLTAFLTDCLTAWRMDEWMDVLTSWRSSSVTACVSSSEMPYLGLFTITLMPSSIAVNIEVPLPWRKKATDSNLFHWSCTFRLGEPAGGCHPIIIKAAILPAVPLNSRQYFYHAVVIVRDD